MKFAENGQRPSGHWETAAGTSGRLIGRYRCSYCGECRELATATLAKYKYCPNCGAAMSGTAEKGFCTNVNTSIRTAFATGAGVIATTAAFMAATAIAR